MRDNFTDRAGPNSLPDWVSMDNAGKRRSTNITRITFRRMERNADRVRSQMNSAQTIELFYTHVHRQAVRLLETFIWLKDVRKWEAEQDVAGEVWEQDMIMRIRNAVTEFTVVLLIGQRVPRISRSGAALAMMQDRLTSRAQELEDLLKQYDTRNESAPAPL